MTKSTTSHARPGSLSAAIALAVALAGPLAAVTGAFFAYQRILAPLTGFRVFGLALPLSLVAIAVALWAVIRARGNRNPRARRRGRIAMVLGAMTFAAMIGLALPSLGRPLINDITTDPADPPAFVYAARLDGNRERNMSYPDEFAAVQRKGYPHLAPLYLKRPPAEVFVRAKRALESLPFTEVTTADPEDGHLEAKVESRIFHFIDDVVVRIRPYGRGSRVDVRSKSRDGRGDLGANAMRVETLLSLMR